MHKTNTLTTADLNAAVRSGAATIEMTFDDGERVAASGVHVARIAAPAPIRHTRPVCSRRPRARGAGRPRARRAARCASAGRGDPDLADEPAPAHGLATIGNPPRAGHRDLDGGAP